MCYGAPLHSCKYRRLQALDLNLRDDIGRGVTRICDIDCDLTPQNDRDPQSWTEIDGRDSDGSMSHGGRIFITICRF